MQEKISNHESKLYQYTYVDKLDKDRLVFECVAKDILEADKNYELAIGKDPKKQNNIACSLKPEAKKKLEGYIRFGGGGHEREYTLNLEGFGSREYIPQNIADAIQKELGGEWDVSNRGSRIEIYNISKFGSRDDTRILEAINKILGDEYQFETRFE